MAKKKWDWEKLKAEFFENTMESLVDFVERKTNGKAIYFDSKNKKRIRGVWLQKTQGWVKERKEYWNNIMQDPTYFREKYMTEERRKKQAEVIDKAIEFWNNMLIGFMMNKQKKMKEGKGPHIDELIKFGKMIREYSGIKLLDDTPEVNVDSKPVIQLDVSNLKDEIQKIEKVFDEEQNDEKK